MVGTKTAIRIGMFTNDLAALNALVDLSARYAVQMEKRDAAHTAHKAESDAEISADHATIYIVHSRACEFIRQQIACCRKTLREYKALVRAMYVGVDVESARELNRLAISALTSI